MSVSFILNKSYGGFRFSQAALDEYTRRRKAVDPAFTMDPQRGGRRPDLRWDPVMVDVVRSLGEGASASTSKLVVESVPGEYGEDYIIISDYDGMEDYEVEYDRHRLARIAALVRAGGEPRDVLASIAAICEECQ